MSKEAVREIPEDMESQLLLLQAQITEERNKSTVRAFVAGAQTGITLARSHLQKCMDFLEEKEQALAEIKCGPQPTEVL